MKKVYTNENRFIVHNINNIIEAQGIETTIKNEFAQGAIGEISAFDAWPEIWILNDNDLQRANEIIKSLKDQKESDWACSHCSENNDASFEICWNCQSENA